MALLGLSEPFGFREILGVEGFGSKGEFLFMIASLWLAEFHS